MCTEYTGRALAAQVRQQLTVLYGPSVALSSQVRVGTEDPILAPAPSYASHVHYHHQIAN